MRRLIILLLGIQLLIACSPSDPAQTPIPTVPPLEGNVSIEMPLDGAVIYSEVFVLRGTAQGVDTFQLLITDTADETIARAMVDVEDGQWAVNIPHTYNGEPTEAIISALPTNASVAGDYDLVSIILSSIDNRPDGVFGSIISPIDESVVGGDFIPISGNASGLFEGTFILALENEGEIISQLVMTHNNPNLIDDMPWSADLQTNDYTGEATIRMYYQDARDGTEVTLDSVVITISQIAG